MSNSIIPAQSKWSPVYEDIGPSFQERRKANHSRSKMNSFSGMVPDKGFDKQLKKLDPELAVVWDWSKERWEIWQFPKDANPHHVMTIQTKDKTYRQLGADILLKLQQFRPERFSVEQIISYLDEHDTQLKRRKTADFKDFIGAVARETQDYSRLVISVPRSYKVQGVVGNG